MPFETTSAICSILMGGILRKYPKLRLAFAHGNEKKNQRNSFEIQYFCLGGGSYPYTIGRIDHGHECRPDLCALKDDNRPSSYIGQFYVDSLVHDARALKYLVDTIGEHCIMLGSDAPFPLGEEHPGELILQTYSDDLDKCEKMLHSNARRFFKIE